jgi:hypothetical protein
LVQVSSGPTCLAAITQGGEGLFGLGEGLMGLIQRNDLETDLLARQKVAEAG